MPDDYSDFGAHPSNIQWALKTARILNQTESGVAKVFADQSENFLERQYGSVIVAMDLDFSSDEYDIGEVITTTLVREYYSDLNRTAGQSFEHALTAVNQQLADLAAEGQNAWVGKLNAVLGVVHENEIHLTLTGKAEAFLVRGASVTHITADLHSRPNEATAKTFLNVASGELEVGDKLLLATGEVFNHLSQHDVRRHLYLHPPTRAIRRIADQLTERGNPDRLAAAVVELTTIDLVSAETLSDEPDAIVLGAPRGHFESLGRLRPFREDTPIAEYTGKARKYYEKKIAPKVRRGTRGVRRKSQDFIAQRRGEDTAGTAPRPAAGTPEPEHRPARTDRRRQANQVVDKVTATASQAGRKAAAVARPAWQRFTAAVTRLWHKTGIPQSAAWKKFRQIIRPLTDPISRLWQRTGQGPHATLYRNLLIGVVIVLGLSLFFSINSARTAQAERQTREQIAKVQEEQAQAEASFIFKDVPAARAKITETKLAADKLPDNVLKADVTQLRTSVTGSYERIFNISVIAGDPLADFGPDKTFAAEAGATFYGMGSTGELKSYDQTSKETKVLNPNPLSQGSAKGLATTSNGDLLILSDQPAVVSVATDGSASTADLAAGGTWEAAVSLDTVQQSLYLLDSQGSQIWRHTRTTAGFGKGEAYLTEPVDLKNATDIVAGAQIYVLRGGEILQLTGGKSAPLTIAGIPAPNDSLQGAVAISANYSTKLIYVADPKNHRVVELNEKGEYQRQFIRDQFTGLTDILVDDKTNTLYGLAGGKLYPVPLAS